MDITMNIEKGILLYEFGKSIGLSQGFPKSNSRQNPSLKPRWNSEEISQRN
jgi:hypothetical protein